MEPEAAGQSSHEQSRLQFPLVGGHWNSQTGWGEKTGRVHSRWLTRPVYATPHTLQVFSHPECTGCEWVLVYRHSWFQSLPCHLLKFYDVLRRPLAESLCLNAFYYFLVCDFSPIIWGTLSGKRESFKNHDHIWQRKKETMNTSAQ